MNRRPLDPAKFQNPRVTAKGEPRAAVALRSLDTLWFNTGTLCNLACVGCYIESSPRNDRLVYLTAAEVGAYLDEIAALGLRTREIGFTGGEPFMNPAFPAMLRDALERGFEVLVLTNATRPMARRYPQLDALTPEQRARCTMRVSLDHFTAEGHEAVRGPRSWQPAIDGLRWLVDHGFPVHVAGQLRWDDDEATLRAGYGRLFAELGVPIDAASPRELVLFPEMDADRDVAEITASCWGILGKSPESVMCSSSRMVVKRHGASSPVVLACTLIAYDPRFELGARLTDAFGSVPLNHPHCATFCVLGGAACS